MSIEDIQTIPKITKLISTNELEQFINLSNHNIDKNSNDYEKQKIDR